LIRLNLSWQTLKRNDLTGQAGSNRHNKIIFIISVNCRRNLTAFGVEKILHQPAAVISTHIGDDFYSMI
jgi:hypothetical protein